MIKLKWHGELPNLDMDDLELTVLKNITDNLYDLEAPSELIFHNVFLESDYSGASVLVWGSPGDDEHFHCEYYATTEWETLNPNETQDD